ncbi:hypothetical protein OP10G_1544 [Fimbriimonas ginsengisoli Gsoil 348]|uniref:Uncharacterized protein n=2 Tax=Fimbriimonas ginsengisoli TaxID=1005039 RepID=A0A068NNC7_FIMGI|nr:hypothetical protein OP10G_1544 [Fimbriimonas ginsengisoli Gsoil 348]
MARHLGEDPLVVSAVIHASIERQVLDASLRVLERHSREPSVVAGLSKVLKDLGTPTDLRPNVAGEFVLSHRTCEVLGGKETEFLTSMGITNVDEARFRSLRLTWVRQANEATLLKFWRTYYEALPKDPDDVSGIEAAAEQAKKAIADASGPARFLYDQISLFTDTNDHPFATAIAQRRVLKAGLTFAKGLVRPDPASRESRDPFGNGPLKYASPGGNLRIYSVGLDGKDDGGDRKRDLGIELPYPSNLKR